MLDEVAVRCVRGVSACLGYDTYLAIARLKVGQKGGEGALQHVRIAANGMRGVTIVRALAMEA